jgi:DsbC/DsbD-like thiol-disulfide interchange protein
MRASRSIYTSTSITGCARRSAFRPWPLPPQGQSQPSAELKEALNHIPASADARRPGDPVLKGVRADLAGAKPRLVLEAEFPGGTEHADIFVEGPQGLFIPLPRRTGAGSGELATFEVDLSDGVDVQELKGKTLTATLVSGSGQSEATFPVN